jgi:hypothetical protein
MPVDRPVVEFDLSEAQDDVLEWQISSFDALAQAQAVLSPARGRDPKPPLPSMYSAWGVRYGRARRHAS